MMHVIVRSCPSTVSYLYNRLVPQRQLTTTAPPNAEFNRGYASNAACLLKRALEYDTTKTPEDAVVARELIVSALFYLLQCLPLTETEIQTLLDVPPSTTTTTRIKEEAAESQLEVLFAMLCRILVRVARYCLPIARDMVQVIWEWEMRHEVSGKASASIVSVLEFARDRGLQDVGTRLVGVILYGVRQGAKEWKL